MFNGRLRGTRQLRYAIDDILRAAEQGIRGFLIADPGLLQLVSEMQAAGQLPASIVWKVSAVLAPSNPLAFQLLERLGGSTVNVPSDLTLGQIAEMRAVSTLPIDLYVETPDAMGGVVRGHEAADLIAVAAPMYVKFGLRNSRLLYPSGLHLVAEAAAHRAGEGAPGPGRAGVDCPQRAQAVPVRTGRARARHPGAGPVTGTRPGGTRGRPPGLAQAAVVARLAVRPRPPGLAQAAVVARLAVRPRLRSQAWLAGDDEVALEHRVALASAGLAVGRGEARPVIGIANSASDLNPCNLPLRDLAVEVKAGIEEAGGVGAEFGTISLGEDLMKPSAMLYRNLLAIEIEEMVRANPLDGLVVLANCDKSVPGALMGAISANVPVILVTGGSRPVAQFRGQRVGTGTALWRMWDERRAGRLDDADWAAFERCLSCGRGACNTMGTASTMAVLSEVLGLMVPGSASIPAGDDRGRAAAREAGRAAVGAVLADLRPQSILTRGLLRQRDRRTARDRRLHQRGHPPRGDGRPGRVCRSRWRRSAGSARRSRCWPTSSRPGRA